MAVADDGTNDTGTFTGCVGTAPPAFAVCVNCWNNASWFASSAEVAVNVAMFGVVCLGTCRKYLIDTKSRGIPTHLSKQLRSLLG